MSTKIFNKLFFEETGVTIFKYYKNFRLTFAKEILLNEKKKVYQVSALLGYSQPIGLIHSFQRKKDIAPNQLAIKSKSKLN